MIVPGGGPAGEPLGEMDLLVAEIIGHKHSTISGIDGTGDLQTRLVDRYGVHILYISKLFEPRRKRKCNCELAPPTILTTLTIYWYILGQLIRATSQSKVNLTQAWQYINHNCCITIDTGIP